MSRMILQLLAIFVEAIIIYRYFSSLFIPSKPPIKQLLSLSIIYGVFFIISLFENTGINIFCFFVINAIFLISQYKIHLSPCLFHAAILTAIMGITELSVFGIMSKIAPHFLRDEGTYLVFYTVFSKLLFLIIVYVLAHFSKGKAYERDNNDYSELILLLIPIASIFIMFTFLSIGESYSFSTPSNIMVTVCSIFLLLINLLVFGIGQYNNKKHRDFTEMQLLLQKESDSAEYYEMLLSQSENQSILIHDIKRHLQSINLLNDNNEKGKITAYIQQLLVSSDLRETSRLCDNEILNAILCRYQRECHDKQINFHADIRSGIINHIMPHDLTSLFCNLLDNALDAAINIPDSFVELTVKKKEKTPFIIIVIINSCRTSPIYNQNGELISHKKNSTRHGFGIKSINKVVKQYDGNIQMYYDQLSATYHTIITLTADD